MDLRRLWTLFVAAAAVAVAGCHSCDTELVSREVLFDEYNGNADKMPTLWAIADIEVELAGRAVFNKVRLPDGRIYFRRGPAGPEGPHYFMLRGKEASETYFELGIDAAAGEFYYWVNPPSGQGQARWGRLADLHKPGAESLEIDPTQLLSALGLAPWPQDLDASTQVILKTPDKPCVYVMSSIAKRPEWGGWYLRAEQWLDRHTTPHRPRRMWLFDRQGRGVMEAVLDRYRPVNAPDAGDNPPSMPTDIRMTWPNAEGIRGIRIRLSGQAVGSDDRFIPPPRAFKRRIPADIDDARPLRAAPGDADAGGGSTK